MERVEVNYLVFGIHNHQPVGNFDYVFKQACEQSYLPFLKAILNRAWFRFSLHVSGCLLDWAEKNCRELFELIEELVNKKQVELMGGGMYEPILAAIPRRDAVAQIKRMSEYLNEHFGITPRGAWLPERVWDPNVVSILADAGMKYTVLDESHFRYAGLDERELLGFYLTEREGKTVALFPIDRVLRYYIPFKEPELTVRRIEETCAGRNERFPPVLTYADDGEKFGVWPGTHKWVYLDGWLERFLDRIEQEVVSDRLEIITLSDALEKFGASGRIYLPTASYEEMMRWALPAERSAELEDLWRQVEARGETEKFKNFLRGGVWDNFLVKYPEANRLHKKMLYVSNKIWRAHKNPEDNPQAFDELWKGQCNCPYWHGLFGGLYLSHLREAVWNHLIRAEAHADKKLYGSARFGYEVMDFDSDGREEIRVECDELGFVVSPHRGGALEIFEDKKLGVLFTNNLARRFEAYHKKLKDAVAKGEHEQARSIHDIVTAKEEGLEKLLVYDRYERNCFIDRFLYHKPSLDEISFSISSQANSMAVIRYGFSVNKKGKGIAVKLSYSDDSAKLAKEYEFSNKGLVCNYRASNGFEQGFFAAELNFNLLAPRTDDRYIEVSGRTLDERFASSRGLESDVNLVRIVDEWRKFAIKMSLAQPADFYRYPVETVSNSESGLERTYQCTSLVFLWQSELLKNGVSIKVELERLKDE